MVRVIPVHNFLEQNVAQIEEPTATCIVNTSESKGEFLLLALPSHCIEVRDLSVPELKFVTAFPTVDLAAQVLHCAKGNYVATLENKVSRDNNHNGSFVRVYVNWAVQERQAMRARIAGRVTPSLNRPQNSLEMIELQLNPKPTAIACCQATGNLLVAAGNTLILHEFKVETQNPSKLKFIDFEARPWSLGLHFSPTHLEIVEDFISVMDSTRFSVFRLTNPIYDDIDQFSSLTSTTSSSNDKTTISTDFCSMETVDNSISSCNDPNLTRQKNNSNQKINVDKNSNPKGFLNLEARKNKKSNCIDWNRIGNDEETELESLMNKGLIDQNYQPFSINLPSVCLERAGPGHTLNPFILNSADTEVFIKTTSPDNGWSENYAVKNILRLKIARANDFSGADGSIEMFTSFVLKPLYMKKNRNNNKLKKSILRSEKYTHLNGVTCLICTIQEGYIYHFNLESNDASHPTCLTTYPFTAPVIHVALEYTVLHALTEAGLESYTLRLPHYVAKTLQSQNSKSVCPDISEPVCLIGLRPFLGVQKLLSSDNCIVLLAKAENSWTLYSLRLPRPENVYYDIVNAAKNHRTTSPSTYRHLLEEAHAMLRLSKDIANFNSNDNDQMQNEQKLENLYDQSCALLADYFIKSDTELERRLCIPYYKMSRLKPSEVLARKSTYNAPGLVTYVTDILMTIKSGPEADALFQGQDIVEIFSGESREDLLKIILGSVVLREYATEKLIKLLVSQNRDDYSQLALTLLFIQAEKQVLAETALDHVSDRFLQRNILEYPELLFDEDAYDPRNRDTASFSDLSTTLLLRRSVVFAKILTQLVEEEVLTLSKVMQVFLEYLPSRVGRDGHDAASSLQQFVEIYLHSYFSKLQDKNDVVYDLPLIEAFKILIRSYLGKLMQSRVYPEKSLSSDEWQDEDAYLFESQRPKYLDKMPPCAKDYQKIMNAIDMDEFSRLNNVENNRTVRFEVLKLQALLASDFLPEECLREVQGFLDAEEIDGGLAFRTLCNRNTEVVTQMLIEKCPQAVLQYAKDMYTKETEWKLLVDLLQQEISRNNSSQESRLFFEQTMIETLKYAAEILPLKSLHYIIPKEDDESFQHYTEVCSQIVHAEHVKSLLMGTGRQLLSTLNL